MHFSGHPMPCNIFSNAHILPDRFSQSQDLLMYQFYVVKYCVGLYL